MSGHLHPDHTGEHEGHVGVEHHHVDADNNQLNEAPQDAKAFEVHKFKGFDFDYHVVIGSIDNWCIRYVSAKFHFARRSY